MEIREYREYREYEIEKLYTSVGWTAYTKDLAALKRGFLKSLCILAAYDGDALLGIIRTVGDGETILLIQDILVSPAYQRKGVGTALVREILDRYQSVRQIQLTTDDTPETVAFYKALGFRPLSEIGCCGFMRV
jgi:ribosomal protein S18 acetylase RimI-like enzyme